MTTTLTKTQMGKSSEYASTMVIVTNGPDSIETEWFDARPATDDLPQVAAGWHVTIPAGQQAHIMYASGMPGPPKEFQLMPEAPHRTTLSVLPCILILINTATGESKRLEPGDSHA